MSEHLGALTAEGELYPSPRRALDYLETDPPEPGRAIEIGAGLRWGILAGATTNPSLLAKEDGDPADIIRRICDLVDGPVSAEVVAKVLTDAELRQQCQRNVQHLFSLATLEAITPLAAGESVRFQQPGPASVALNRVAISHASSSTRTLGTTMRERGPGRQRRVAQGVPDPGDPRRRGRARPAH